MKSKLVSVIIPTKNRLDFLKQTVRSVTDQSYKNIEIIVVDDGSTDDTFEYFNNIETVTIYKNNSNLSGPSSSRNIGIKNASGDFILFLDDDDLIHPDHISNFMRYVSNLPSNYILSSSWVPFTQEENKISIGKVRSLKGSKDKYIALASMINPTIQDNICIHSLFFPKKVFVNTLWDERLFTNGDIDFYGRVLLDGYKLYGIETNMAYYRFHNMIRVAGSFSLKGITSSTKYKLKWSELLFKYKDISSIKEAMLMSIMASLLNWQLFQKEKKEWITLLQKEFKKWNGKKYFLPLSSNVYKKRIAELIINVFGLSAWKYIFAINKKHKFSKNIHNEQDVSIEHIEILKKYLK